MDKNLLLTIFLVAAGCAWQLFGGEARVCEGRRGVFSPDGSRIAFECERGGRLAVGVVPVKGGDVEWVASGPGNAGQPAWAADGSLVYTYCHDTNTALAAVQRKATDGGVNIWRWKGGRAEQVTFERALDYSPSAAPDGTVWFVTTRGEEKSSLRGTGLCKAHVAALAPGTTNVGIKVQYAKSDTGAMQPTVSPSGRLLLWGEMRGFRGNWRVVAAPVDNLEKAVALTPPDAACHSPRWSPDGRRVCYTGYHVGDPGWCVYVQELVSGAETRVCEGRNPCFSPDGRNLVYDRDGQLFMRPAPPVASASEKPRERRRLLRKEVRK